MLRPIFSHSHVPSKRNAVRADLKLALEWWETVLQQEIVQEVKFDKAEQVLDLFCDARSSPPRIAAVLVDEAGQCLYTDWEPDAALLRMYARKDAGDKSIMELELLSIVLGVSTFTDKLRNKNVRVWSDNTGSECVLRKGSSKKATSNLAVHGLWLFTALGNIGMWIDRVPTKANIADLPSREEYDFLENTLRASWWPPRIAAPFYEPEQWRSMAQHLK